MNSVSANTEAREPSALDQLDVTLNAYQRTMTGRVLVADDLYFKAFRLKLHAILEDAVRRETGAKLLYHDLAGPTPYTAPLTVFAHQAQPGWQIPDAKTEETWHPISDVTECADPACEFRKARIPCVVIVSAAYGDGCAHHDEESSLSVRIPASVTA